jgi:hypothetical protein
VTISHLRFWEVDWVGTSSFAGFFTWEIRANSVTNKPGELLHSGVSTNLSRVGTGRLMFGILPEYVNTFEVPSIALPAGTYWLVLHNGDLSNTATADVYWETATSPTTDPSYLDPLPFSGTWISNYPPDQSRLALQVYGIADAARPRVNVVYRSTGPRIAFTTVPDATYSVEYKDNITEVQWRGLPGAGSVPGTGAEVEVVDDTPGVAGRARRFYRVVMTSAAPPPPSVLESSGRPLALGSSYAKAPAGSLRARFSAESKVIGSGTGLFRHTQ